jgi:hypothetical protein
MAKREAEAFIRFCFVLCTHSYALHPAFYSLLHASRSVYHCLVILDQSHLYILIQSFILQAHSKI